MAPFVSLQIVAAGLVPLIVGALWYHPSMFGTLWMSLKRVTPEMAERSARQSLRAALITVLLGIFAATMLLYIDNAFRIDTYVHAVFASFCTWLAFVVPASMQRVLWDHVPLSLFCIETGEWLATLTLMNIVLVL